jgi:hypothetical protein
MKTKLETKTIEYYAERECYAIVGEKLITKKTVDDPKTLGEWRDSVDCNEPIYCGGDIDWLTGVCKKCGAQSPKTVDTYKTGIEWLAVSLNKHGTATFHYDVENENEYARELIAAIRRAGGRCNMVWPDGCKNPDGYDGTYGVSVGPSSMTINGRYSLERI